MEKLLDISRLGRPNGLLLRMSLTEYVKQVEDCRHADAVISLIAGLPHRRFVWNGSVKVDSRVSVREDVMACLWLLEIADWMLNLEAGDGTSVRLTAFQAFGKFKENLAGSDGPPIVTWTKHEPTNQRLEAAVCGLMEKLRSSSERKPSGFEKYLAKDAKPLEMLRRACVNLYSDACYGENCELTDADACRRRLRQCLLDHDLYDEVEQVHCTGKPRGHSFSHAAAQHLAEHALSMIKATMPWIIEHSPAGDSLNLLRDRRILAGLQQHIREISNQSGFGEDQAKKGKKVLRLLMVLDSIITNAAYELKPTGSGWWDHEE